MSCFFCDSFFHISQNCQYNVKCRKRIAGYKNCCSLCLSPFTVKHDAAWSTLCEDRQKCFICYTQAHHTVFCPDYENASNYFVPYIPTSLLLRFLSMLEFIEQNTFAFSSPEIFKIAEPKPYQIKRNATFEDLHYSLCKNTVISQNQVNLHVINDEGLRTAGGENTHNIRNRIFHEPSSQWRTFFKIMRSSNFLILKIRHLAITSSTISSINLFQLLSTYTKKISFSNVTLYPQISFKDLIKKIPNTDVIEIAETNIQIPTSWINELWNFKNGNNFRQLTITTADNRFDVSLLAEFIKKRSLKNVKIHMIISRTVDYNSYQRKIEENLSDTFKEVRGRFFRGSKSKPFLKIKFPYGIEKCYSL